MTIVQSLSNSPTYNLAFEEYLFTEFESDFLFFYINEPAVIIGSNQAVANEVNIDFCHENNIQVVRRKSGGGAVYHDKGNLNFSFIGNKNIDRNILSDDFLQPIVEMLNALDVSVNIGKRKDLWLPDGCKVSGTASQIRKNRELHHGTLLINADLEMLENALAVKVLDNNSIKSTPSVRSLTKNILDYLVQTNGIAYQCEQFIQQFIQLSTIRYKQALRFNTSFKSDSIAKYESTYLSDNWNFRK